jgi:hypothetical protein
MTLRFASSTSGILVLGRLPLKCTLKFTTCFDVSHSTAHTCGPEANFTNNTSIKLELAMNTLRKVKYVKTTLSNIRLIQIAKSNQELV